MKERNNKTEQQIKTTSLSIAIVLIDFVVFFLSWLFISEHSILGRNSISYKTYLSLFIIYLILMIIMNNVYDGYAFGRRRISENAYSLSLACAITAFIFYFLDTLAFRKFYTPWYAIVGFIIQVIFNVYFCKYANDFYFNKYIKKNTLVIYGTDYDLTKVKDIPFFDKKYIIKKKLKSPKTFKEIDKILDKYDTVFISGIKATLRNGIIKSCVNKDIETYVVPHVGDVIMAGGKYVEELPVPMIRIERGTNDLVYTLFKRIFDIIVAGLATIILSPFMLLTALAIKLYDGGPIIYKQIRLTQDRKEFTIYKFRSMRIDAEKDGVARLVSKNDNRITPIGKIIRAIRFDELPQVFNILKGDMSIVGPRPERPEIAKQYEKIYPSFGLRLQVKAGLTGYAQIYGKYNTEPIDKLKMDLYYVNKMSFLFDIQLCFMTIKTLFMKDSTAAIEEGKVTASKTRDIE